MITFVISIFVFVFVVGIVVGPFIYIAYGLASRRLMFRGRPVIQPKRFPDNTPPRPDL